MTGLAAAPIAVTETRPQPTRHCLACDRGLYAAVRFCPFCGAAQAGTEAQRPEPPPPSVARQPPAPIAFRLEPAPPAPRAPVAVGASPIPSVAPGPPQAPPSPPPARKGRPARQGFLGRTRPRLRQVVLAAVLIAGLAAFAMARRDPLPAPARIGIGPAWSAVALDPFQPAPLLRLTGDGPFGLRLDGERVLRVAPGSGASLRLKTLRSLELRAGRAGVTVTLTPRRE